MLQSKKDNNDTLGVTGTHPLYSLDRQCFVPVEDLHVGKHLLSKSGIITVVSKTYDPTPQEVYNLEVGQWHNFLVGVSGVVAHNGPCTKIFNILGEFNAGKTIAEFKITWEGKQYTLYWTKTGNQIYFGNRSQLADILGTTSNIEAHHLVPWKVCE